MSTCREGKLAVSWLFLASRSPIPFFGLCVGSEFGCLLRVLGVTLPHFFVMVVSFQRTIDICCEGLPAGSSPSDVVSRILEYFDRESQHGIAAFQEYPGRVARVTFVKGGEAAKVFLEEQGVVILNGVECRVVQLSPPPPQVSTVIVSWFTVRGIK